MHPVAVTANTCSNWALRNPSSVTDVQPSGHVRSRWVPTFIIGSIVKVCPSCIRHTVKQNLIVLPCWHRMFEKCHFFKSDSIGFCDCFSLSNSARTLSALNFPDLKGGVFFAEEDILHPRAQNTPLQNYRSRLFNRYQANYILPIFNALQYLAPVRYAHMHSLVLSVRWCSVDIDLIEIDSQGIPYASLSPVRGTVKWIAFVRRSCRAPGVQK